MNSVLLVFILRLLGLVCVQGGLTDLTPESLDELTKESNEISSDDPEPLTCLDSNKNGWKMLAIFMLKLCESLSLDLPFH